MKTLKFVELDDVIRPNDYMRPLNKCPHYDEWMDTSAYGGYPLDTMKWYPVKYQVGSCWFGKTWREFYKAVSDCEETYEVIRGNVPKNHTLRRIEEKGNYRYITDK